ncbi:hypothetical protein GJ496_010049 [Pomphorhynchus laevis]|nr:hypothetical protein GJ496_010049 [Pomphorhynchus laevis]
MYAPWDLTSSSNQTNIVSIKGIPFKKLKLLGEGYQSVVYEAKKFTSEFRCAVKIVSFKHPDPREQKDLFKTFLKEVDLLIKLNNQSLHIARIYDYDIDHFEMYGKIVMELGTKDFRSLLPLRIPATAKIIGEPQRKYYWKQMIEAIRVIHLNGITHSDVKPENFIFVRNILKIIDFGTPDYMPPEVCRPSRNSAMMKFGYKADIWSLGCILYEMSFGQRPFEHIHGDIEKMSM